MLKAAKLLALQAARRIGGYEALRESRWRQERLLILCYHGVSLQDEHCWNPGLYIPREMFEQRMSALREHEYCILTLRDALSRLYSGRLPRKSVSITFDDGFADFLSVAYPILIKYEVPATLYLTSFYSGYQRPVFDVMCSYLLWKGRDCTLNTAWPEDGESLVFLSDRAERETLATNIRRFTLREGYSAEQKDDLLRKLATQLHIDYETLTANRLLHIMSANELRTLDPNLVEVELHSHRHRVPLDEERFKREILQNREYIRSVTGGQFELAHFCYPSGVTSPAFLPWLRDLNVRSGTTCKHGLASPSDNPLLLPRFLDTCAVSQAEFEGWLSGVASILPGRRHPAPKATDDGILL